MASNFVFDVTAATFEAAVLAKSKETPVLLDFWADWCGPCKTLRPILDRLAEEYAGAFLLGAVNTEAEQDLAYAFEVQSIPLCVLMVDGRPADGFQGAISEAEIRQFLTKAGIEPGGGAATEPEAPVDADAKKLVAARAALFGGDWRSVRATLAEIAEEHEAFAPAQRILDGLAMFEETIDSAEGEAARAALRGREQFEAGESAAAVESWVDSAAADRAWRGGLARRAAVLGFETLAVNDAGREIVRELRSRLATLIY